MTSDDELTHGRESLERLREQAARPAAEGDVAGPGARRRPRKRATAPEAAVPARAPSPFTTSSFDEDADQPEPNSLTTQADTRPAVTQQVAAPRYWEPGPRLHARVHSDAAPMSIASRPDRGARIATAILAVALLIAIGLYLLANVLVDDSGDVQETAISTEQTE